MGTGRGNFWGAEREARVSQTYGKLQPWIDERDKFPTLVPGLPKFLDLCRRKNGFRLLARSRWELDNFTRLYICDIRPLASQLPVQAPQHPGDVARELDGTVGVGAEVNGEGPVNIDDVSRGGGGPDRDEFGFLAGVFESEGLDDGAASGGL